MSTPALALCLAGLAAIGALPRIFFRPGRLNLRWWLTAGPFLVAGGALGAALAGRLQPILMVGDGGAATLSAAAALLAAAGLALVALTIASHDHPLALWHQDDDAPRAIVTHGAYARIRHPFYAAFLLILLACALALPHPLTAGALAYAAVRLDRTAAREERRLLASAFGGEYAAYLARTGRFVPRRRAWPAEPR